jgi:RNA polymerase sigma-70 factor (ECF subfamily)
MRMMTDDDELAIKTGSGDAQAFRLLPERHYDRIYRVAYRFFGNRADAENIAQDVCVVLPIKLKSFTAHAVYDVDLSSCGEHLSRPTTAMNQPNSPQ